MIKGIIFDVDGVIINAEKVHFLTYKKVLTKYGYNLTERGYKKYFSGKSIKGGLLSLIDKVKLKYSLPLENFIEKFSQEKIQTTLPIFKTELYFYENTLNFIKKIHKGGIKLKKIGYVVKNPVLALSTGLEKVAILEVLKYHDLKKFFTVLITAKDYFHSKPHPENYLVALSRMKLLNNEVFGIEDTLAGIESLNRAGIFSVAITTTHSNQELKKAKLIVTKLTDLL